MTASCSIARGGPPPYERPDLSGGRITPLVEIGLAGNLNERASHAGGLIRVTPYRVLRDFGLAATRWSNDQTRYVIDFSGAD